MISRLVLRNLLISGPKSYSLGVLAAAAATGAQLAFRDFFLQVPFLLYFPATILAAYFGGWRAGLAGTALSAVAATLLFLGPHERLFGGSEIIRLAIFVLVCLLHIGLLWSLQTISVQLQAEREAVRLLAQEGNHRIGNSLQLIAAALHLQVSAARVGEARDALQAALSRVSAVARIHRRLHEGTPAATLSFRKYLADTCNDMAAQLGRGAELKADCDEFELPVDRALKLGLILNELLLNAFKHGGAGRPIEVECRAAAAEVALSVADHGPGFPAGYDPARGTTLGMKLVTTFAAELGGRLDLRRAEDRTVVTVTIPA
jgi:two-component system, sensor histidine kinase PdtaS